MALMRRYRKKAVKKENVVMFVFVKARCVWGHLSSFVGELVSF
jgi:hypothetical protein